MFLKKKKTPSTLNYKNVLMSNQTGDIIMTLKLGSKVSRLECPQSIVSITLHYDKSWLAFSHLEGANIAGGHQGLCLVEAQKSKSFNINIPAYIGVGPNFNPIKPSIKWIMCLNAFDLLF